jgi:5S rRNA maturation endonuclease (ribonuclease M5)
MKNKLTFNEAKQIPIIDYLDKFGIMPAKISGNDYWYFSPFRDERTPSFKVNVKKNLWYDHGLGEGGSIIDLGARLHQCSLSQFLEDLSEDKHSFNVTKNTPSVHAQENRLEILAVKELTDPGLIQYLKERGIEPGNARLYCPEVEFAIKGRSYTAIAFPTNSGSYELRNRWFKGSSSPKDISLIKGDLDKLCIVEGFIDFLSLQQLQGNHFTRITRNSSFLILNSLALLNRSVSIIKNYRDVNLFLDNDSAGKDAKDTLVLKGVHFNDASRLYPDSKDLNEFLIKKLKFDNKSEIKHSKGVRM